jgi:PPOX class probable F420-dependent enzyme
LTKISNPKLPEDVTVWFAAPNFGQLATIEPDGRPHLSVVWVLADEGDIVFSTTKERRKYSNLMRDPRATVLVSKPADPYGYCEIRGRTAIRDDPEGALIQRLSHEYTGAPFTMDTPATQRVIVRIVAEKVLVHG